MKKTGFQNLNLQVKNPKFSLNYCLRMIFDINS